EAAAVSEKRSVAAAIVRFMVRPSVLGGVNGSSHGATPVTRGSRATTTADDNSVSRPRSNFLALLPRPAAYLATMGHDVDDAHPRARPRLRRRFVTAPA